MAGSNLEGITSPISILLGNYKVVLGSQSPRRLSLLKSIGLDIEVRPSHIDETYPDNLLPDEIPLFLAKRKASSLKTTLAKNEILITSDTIVELEGRVLEKPISTEEAINFLRMLSGKWHTVHSGYYITTSVSEEEYGSVQTKVHFTDLSDEDILYYTSYSEVLDKAGGYGIQDWIGLVGIDRIEGSYNNVMGLPTVTIYQALKQLLYKVNG